MMRCQRVVPFDNPSRQIFDYRRRVWCSRRPIFHNHFYFDQIPISPGKCSIVGRLFDCRIRTNFIHASLIFRVASEWANEAGIPLWDEITNAIDSTASSFVRIRFEWCLVLLATHLTTLYELTCRRLILWEQCVDGRWFVWPSLPMQLIGVGKALGGLFLSPTETLSAPNHQHSNRLTRPN